MTDDDGDAEWPFAWSGDQAPPLEEGAALRVAICSEHKVIKIWGYRDTQELGAIVFMLDIADAQHIRDSLTEALATITRIIESTDPTRAEIEQAQAEFSRLRKTKIN